VVVHWGFIDNVMCPSPVMGRFWGHSLCSCLTGKMTLGRGFEYKEVSKLREAITALGY
jgi:hypothetical protein